MLPAARTDAMDGLTWSDLIAGLEDIVARAERIEPRYIVRLDTLRARAAAKVSAVGGPWRFRTPPHFDVEQNESR